MNESRKSIWPTDEQAEKIKKKWGYRKIESLDDENFIIDFIGGIIEDAILFLSNIILHKEKSGKLNIIFQNKKDPEERILAIVIPEEHSEFFLEKFP